MMLALPDVTLVMVETLEHKLANLALHECIGKAIFGDILIMTDKPECFSEFTPICRFVKVPNWPNKMGWSLCTWHRMPLHIRTSHALCIQWDSWVTNPEMWSDEFLYYDVIGAPWWYAENNVGNLGFGLRSRRLMQHIIDNQEYYPCTSSYDDDLLCRTYRPQLEEANFKWAPEDIAHRFSFECCKPFHRSKHFGFHGIFNWPSILDKNSLQARLKLAEESPYITKGFSWALLRMMHPHIFYALTCPK